MTNPCLLENHKGSGTLLLVQLSAHLPKCDNHVLGLSLACYKNYLDIGTMTIESIQHSWTVLSTQTA